MPFTSGIEREFSVQSYLHGFLRAEFQDLFDVLCDVHLMCYANQIFSFACRGFCYFNNVAIAARLLRMKLAVERVLIVDWVCMKKKS